MKIPKESIDLMLPFITGQGAGVVVVGVLMSAVKKAWKPVNKKMYLIPAFVLGYGASLAIMLTVGWNWLLFLGGGYIITAGQLLGQNDIWPEIKPILTAILDLVKRLLGIGE